MLSTDRRAAGRAGEDAACAYLEGQGFTTLERNFRTRNGEIDIIVRRGSLLVFVEVKARRGKAFGEPEESVTPAKVRKIRMVATEYLAGEGRARGEVRFDVVAVEIDSGGRATGLRHIEAAF